MSIEGDIRTALLAMDAVAEFNGSAAADTMVIRYEYLEEDDEATDPHIVLDIDSDTPQNNLMGVGGLRYVDLTVTCRAMTMATSKALAEAVRINGTDPGTGLAGYGTASTAFQAVLESEVRTTEPFDDNSGRMWRVTVQSYVVSYGEDV